MDLYLCMMQRAISTVLTQEVDKDQKPIYFVIRTLQGMEIGYQKLEKATLAIFITARRLRYYFQNFQVIIKIDLTVKQVFTKVRFSGKNDEMGGGIVRIGISFEFRGCVRSQALIDFVVDLTHLEGEWEGRKKMDFIGGRCA